MTTGTIDLSSVREIPAQRANGGTMAFQLLSTDLSASTDFDLRVSIDGTNWDIATDAGTDVTDSLTANDVKIMQVELVSGIFYKVVFGGTTTGNVTYKIID